MGNEVVVDLHELDDIAKMLIKTSQDIFPKRVKKFMQDEGTWGKTILREKTSAYTNKRTGELKKSIRKTPVKKHKDGYQVRVYNKAAYAGHVEHGHILAVHGKKTEHFVPGKYPAAYAAMQMKREFPDHVEQFVDDLLMEGFEL